MNRTGNFKTNQLVILIVTVYFGVKGIISGICWIVKKTFVSYSEFIGDWEFYLSRIIPISMVGIILYYIDKSFDKIPKLSGILFVAPELKGKYIGTVRQKEGKVYENVKVTIVQTLSKTEFELYSPGGSVSTSEIVTYKQKSLYKWDVFINISNINLTTPNDPKQYIGTCNLVYDTKKKTLTGIYYTSWGIKGTVELKKIKQ